MASFGFASVRAYAFAAILAAVFCISSTAMAAFQAEEPAAETQASEGAGADAPAAEAGTAGEDEAASTDEGAAQAGDLAASESSEAEAAPNALEASEPGRLQPVFDLIEAGGPVIVILGILSIVSLAVIVVKVIQFTVLRTGDHKFVEKIAQQLKNGEQDKALDALTKRRGVTARVMETALRGRMLSPDEAHVREEVERVARAKLDGLERGLPLLSLVATISPLLGLLGTVLGMIEAFQQLENAGDRVDPAILSGGIWEALLTTAAGLSVAIPAAAFFTWLQRSVEVAGQHMEDAATRVFTATLYEEAEAARKGNKADEQEAA